MAAWLGLSSRGTGRHVLVPRTSFPNTKRTSFRNTKREYHETSFPNAVKRESYARVTRGTLVPSDYGTSYDVCVPRCARP